MEHERLEVHHTKHGDIIAVDVRGRATLGENSELLDRELQRLAADGWMKMLVNLTDVVQMDSSGISALVRQCTGLSRRGGSLRLVCPKGRVHDALSVTRLLEAIPTFDTEAKALASFQQAAARKI
jgi:anti-sigma B factor antagonist